MHDISQVPGSLFRFFLRSGCAQQSMVITSKYVFTLGYYVFFFNNVLHADDIHFYLGLFFPHACFTGVHISNAIYRKYMTVEMGVYLEE